MDQECPICGNMFSQKSLGHHKESCEKRAARRVNYEVYEREVDTERLRNVSHDKPPAAPYGEHNGLSASADPGPPSENSKSPWFPFNSRSDFDFAELALDCAMNNEQIEQMIQIFHRCLRGEDKFSLRDHQNLREIWDEGLGDAEKNLNKARMQATEPARERDTLNGKLEQMRNELTDTQRELSTLRRSSVEEKQSLEQRLDEERKAKERARQQLDSRMEELQRRKSKFAWL